jgi:hypothetical protein
MRTRSDRTAKSGRRTRRSNFSRRGPARDSTRTEFGFSGSGHLIATTDGDTVVFIHDFPYGLPRERTSPAIAFFTGAKPVASYSFRQVLRRFDLVSVSVSHFMWLANMDILTAPLGPKLSVRTSSFRELTFDARTGTLEPEVSVIDRCEVVAYGEVEALEGTFRIEEPRFAKGHLSPPIVFKASASLPPDEEHALHPLEGVQIGPGSSRKPVLLNGRAAVCLRASGSELEAMRVLIQCEAKGACRPILLNAL